ncbi:MAG TPA: isoprenylcysteine carboxylmethyltransferase family protein [Bacteroidales bacterium]|nr:isoprenylcysteine carboxylmethyltransferase family protein [Bacteroidales bacterium]
MGKLNSLGIGPKIGRINIPYLAVTLILNYFYPAIFSFGADARKWLLIAGIVILALALVCYGLTVKSLLMGLRNTRLMITGPYHYCRNPLYATIILLVIPGLALVVNSWLVLTASLVGYIAFKWNIHSEDEEMERFFGEEYRKYRAETPEFFPGCKK